MKRIPDMAATRKPVMIKRCRWVQTLSSCFTRIINTRPCLFLPCQALSLIIYTRWYSVQGYWEKERGKEACLCTNTFLTAFLHFPKICCSDKNFLNHIPGTGH